VSVTNLLIALLCVVVIGFWIIVSSIDSGVEQIIGKLEIMRAQREHEASDAERLLGNIASDVSTIANDVGLVESQNRPPDPDDWP
jgi:ABC-type microcin C transport system permease subunit YejB